MVRRASILMSALAIALLLYAPLFFALLRRAIFVLCPIFGLTGRKTEAPSDLFGIPSLPDSVDVYGYPVPLWMITLLWLILPLAWAGFSFYHWVQHLNRERLGLCSDCGYRLATPWRGKCPRCGLRVGVG